MNNILDTVLKGHEFKNTDSSFKNLVEQRDNHAFILKDEFNSYLDRAKEAISLAKFPIFVGLKRDTNSVLDFIYSRGFSVLDEWIYGLITNFNLIQQSLITYTQSFEIKDKTKLNRVSSKRLDKLSRLFRRYKIGSIQPDIIILTDVIFTKSVIHESNSIHCTIPTIGICDTNTNLNSVNLPILANDDSVDSILYIMEELMSATTNIQNDI